MLSLLVRLSCGLQGNTTIEIICFIPSSKTIPIKRFFPHCPIHVGLISRVWLPSDHPNFWIFKLGTKQIACSLFLCFFLTFMYSSSSDACIKSHYPCSFKFILTRQSPSPFNSSFNHNRLYPAFCYFRNAKSVLITWVSIYFHVISRMQLSYLSIFMDLEIRFGGVQQVLYILKENNYEFEVNS